MNMEKQEHHESDRKIVKNKFCFQDLTKNFVNFNKTTQLYECTICKYVISGIENAYEHIDDMLHKKSLEEAIEEPVEDDEHSILQSRLPYQKLVENKIANSVHKNFYKCYPCNFEFSNNNIEEIDKHIHGKLHNRFSLNTKLSKKTIRKIETVENSFEALVENTITVEHEDYYCNACDKILLTVFSLKEHLKGKTHSLCLRKTNNDASNSQVSKPIQSTTFERSRSDINPKNQEIKKNYSKSVAINEEDSLENAVKFNLNDLCGIKIDNCEATFKILFQNCITLRKKSLTCYLCKFFIPVSDFKFVFDHINDESHQQKANFFSWARSKKTNEIEKLNLLSENQYKKLIMNSVVFKSSHYYCKLCQLRLYNINNVNEHVNGKSHKDLLVKNNIITEESDDVIQKVLLKNETLSVPLSKLKIEQEKKELAQSVTNKPKKIPEKLPQQRKAKNDEKFPYNQDILSFSDRYIARCLEPGVDNIYNFEPEKINFMLLGNSFVFTSGNKNICVLCNFKFPKNLQFLFEHLLHEVHIKNLCDVEEFSKEPKRNPNQINDMELVQSCMVDESEDCVRCLACDITIPNFDRDIKIHMSLDGHISKIVLWKKNTDSSNKVLKKIIENSWYFIDKFFCKVCDSSFSREISFAKHLDDLEHIKKVKLYPSQYKINTCFACSSCWFGKSDYTNHYKENVHDHFMRINNFIFSKMKEAPKRLLRFVSKNIENLMAESNKASSQKDKEVSLLKAVEETVKPIYTDCKAYIFGSRNSFLSFCSSDVDVFLECENNYKNIGSKEACQKYINKVKNQFFIKNKTCWSNITILLQPRVPLIKCQHRETQLKCDISFISGLAVEKTKLLRSYVIAYQPCREMILFLKKWFNTCNLYGSQAVNAYGISWCIIFFLQIKGIFPSVYQLIELNNASNVIDGWQCGFLETIPVAASNYSTKELLTEFFTFYAEFDYCNNVLCPFLGKVLKKSSFVSVNDFPKEMEIYKNRFESEEMEYFRFDSPMCIQDPVDLSQNITKAVKKKQLRYFKDYCEESKNILSHSK